MEFKYSFVIQFRILWLKYSMEFESRVNQCKSVSGICMSRSTALRAGSISTKIEHPEFNIEHREY
jgi:hypothetical protein